MKIVYKTKIEKGTMTSTEFFRRKKMITRLDFEGEHRNSNTSIFNQQLRNALFIAVNGKDLIYLDDLLDRVTLGDRGFLTKVTIDIEGLI